MESCKECDLKFEKERSLHAHIKAHDLKIPDYYRKHFPRFDKSTGEFIEFKDKEYYFSQDFNSRENMAKWFKNIPKDEAKRYSLEVLKKFLQERRTSENKVAPCQVELKSLVSPSILTYSRLFDVPFEDIYREIGFTDRFLYNDVTIKEKATPIPTVPLKVFMDTREQQPLKLNCETELSKLDFGDMTASNEWYSGVFIERKSLQDFIGTLSQFTRLNEEIQRSKILENHLVILVEEPFLKALHFNFTPEIHTKARPEYIWHNVRLLLKENSNIQFLFVKNRQEAAKMVVKILLLRGLVKILDLQYLYDKGILI